MDGILDIGILDTGSFSVLGEWLGLGSSWEVISKIYEEAPKFLGGKLKRMRPSSLDEKRATQP